MQQLNLDGKIKEQLAIEFIQRHEPEEGWAIGFSGGKDSIVLKDLVKKTILKIKPIFYHCMTGVAPAQIYRFIQRYHQRCTHIKTPAI